jgi:hypothetical protein
VHVLFISVSSAFSLQIVATYSSAEQRLPRRLPKKILSKEQLDLKQETSLHKWRVCPGIYDKV